MCNIGRNLVRLSVASLVTVGLSFIIYQLICCEWGDVNGTGWSETRSEWVN